MVWFRFLSIILSVRLVSQVSAHTQQQQEVYGQQIEAEQQRGALTGAEGHAEHPHQTRATPPSLQETDGQKKVTGSEELICVYYYDDKRDGAESYARDHSFRRLDEYGSLRVIIVMCKLPSTLAVATNHNKR